jgi:hypothetical protein
MSQTSYASSQGTKFAGLISDARPSLVESAAALTAVPFGRGVGAEAGDTDSAHLALRDKGTLTYNGDFRATDVIIVTINGVACGTVNFTSTHATTAAAVLAAIVAHADVTAASKSANGRVFSIETEGEVISIAVTGSSVTAAAAVDYVTLQNDVFRGVSVHRHNEAGEYSANDIMDILRQGEIWVDTSITVVADDTAYVDLAGGLGKFTNVSTNNLATGGKFRSSVTGAGLAKIEINLP